MPPDHDYTVTVKLTPAQFVQTTGHQYRQTGHARRYMENQAWRQTEWHQIIQGPIAGRHNVLLITETRSAYADHVNRLKDAPGTQVVHEVEDPTIGGSMPSQFLWPRGRWGTDRPAVVFWTHKTPFPLDPSASKGCLIWSKGGGGMGDLDFPWTLDWEMAYVFGTGWHRPEGGIRSTAVLSGHHMTNRSDGEESSIDKVRHHPTQKPVSLLADEILSRAPDGLVLDPFAGSGSTLIACHQTGRRCYAIELDPRYCDVICRRFQNLTGVLPERSGGPYDFSAEPSHRKAHL